MKQKPHLLLSFLLLWVSTLQAEVRIKITQGMDSALPIGVVPFQWKCSSIEPEDIADIIAADLRNSAKFKPLDRSHLPQWPNSAQKIKLNIWSKLGIDAVLVGQVKSISNNSYSVAYQLVSTNGKLGVILAQNTYRVSDKRWLRYVGHTISDEIFEKLTGIKGVFRTRIAYIVKTNSNQFPYELCISDYDGYNQFTIHRSAQPLMSPTWSPDGAKIAYVTFERGHSSLVIQTLSNGLIRQLTSFPCHNGAPAFSPDGEKLAFALSKTGSLNLYVMNMKSGQINQITDSKSNNTEPTWFPDNQSLAFTSDRTGRPQIYKVNITSGKLQRITWKGQQNQNADVSSDGKIMVMVNTTNGQQHVAKQDLITGSVQILSSSIQDKTPSLSPNNTMIIYSSSQGTGSVLNLISVNKHLRVCLPINNRQVKSPAWSPYL